MKISLPAGVPEGGGGTTSDLEVAARNHPLHHLFYYIALLIFGSIWGVPLYSDPGYRAMPWHRGGGVSWLPFRPCLVLCFMRKLLYAMYCYHMFFFRSGAWAVRPQAQGSVKNHTAAHEPEVAMSPHGVEGQGFHPPSLGEIEARMGV